MSCVLYIVYYSLYTVRCLYRRYECTSICCISNTHNIWMGTSGQRLRHRGAGWCCARGLSRKYQGKERYVRMYALMYTDVCVRVSFLIMILCPFISRCLLSIPPPPPCPPSFPLFLPLTLPPFYLPTFLHHFTTTTTSPSLSPVGAMMIDTWLFLIGGIMMTLASNVYWLIPARLIIGFASGLASVVVCFLSLNILKSISFIRLLLSMIVRAAGALYFFRF